MEDVEVDQNPATILLELFVPRSNFVFSANLSVCKKRFFCFRHFLTFEKSFTQKKTFKIPIKMLLMTCLLFIGSPDLIQFN